MRRLGGCTDDAVSRAGRQLAGGQRIVLAGMTGAAHGALALARRLQGTASVRACPPLASSTLRAISGVALRCAVGGKISRRVDPTAMKRRLSRMMGVRAVCSEPVYGHQAAGVVGFDA
jgi:hypothetical protein